jgi:hypothetical protein
MNYAIRSNRFASLLLLFAFLAAESGQAATEEIAVENSKAAPVIPRVTLQGIVTTAGTPDSRQTLVTGGPELKSTPLCEGGRKIEITGVTGTVITAEGSHQISGKKHCFLATSYTIDEISPGHGAIVGKLMAIEANQFAIVAPSGKSWKFSKLSPSAKKMLNKEVVVELAAAPSTGGEPRWLIVRAFELPVP